MPKPRPFGHYWILGKIGQGGMAEVFRGQTYDFSGNKKEVVIKRILPRIAQDKDFIDLLINEAKIAVNLSHPNIAQVYDLGKVADDYFIVMEYVEGRDLSQIITQLQQTNRMIPLDSCVYLATQLCKGLDYIHNKKNEAGENLDIIHRDISPQNIMLSYFGEVKIIDFGVAKTIQTPEEEALNFVRGKFAYMSPEQSEGKTMDARSDLFALGIVLWETLSTQRLFRRPKREEVVDAVRHMKVLPPSQFRPEIPEELDSITLRLLEKDPEKRFKSAKDLNFALTRFLVREYPRFKSSMLGSFVWELFQDELDMTGLMQSEKTEFTSSQKRQNRNSFEQELTGKFLEATQNVRKEEISFQSVFDEMSWIDETNTSKQVVQAPLKDLPRQSNFDELSQTVTLSKKISRKSWWKTHWVLLLLFLIFILVYLGVVLKSL